MLGNEQHCRQEIVFAFLTGMQKQFPADSAAIPLSAHNTCACRGAPPAPWALFPCVCLSASFHSSRSKWLSEREIERGSRLMTVNVDTDMCSRPSTL